MPEQSGVLIQLEVDENDDLVLPFPSEILEVLGWEEGDCLSVDVFAGRIVIRKVSEGFGNGVGTPESEPGQVL